MKVENLKENDVSAQEVHSKNVDLKEALSVAVTTGTNESKEKELSKAIDAIIKKYKLDIENAANKYGVDKYLIAAIIYYEQQHLARGENGKDEALARAHVNTNTKYSSDRVSVWLGQIQVRRAIEVEGKGKDKVEPITQKEIDQKLIDGEWQARIDRLINPSWNIMYVAAYLKKLQNAREPEFPAIRTRPDILATVYQNGKTDAHPNPLSSDYGKAVNKLISHVKTLMR